MTTRNDIMDALATLLNGMDTVKTVQRKFVQNVNLSMSGDLPMLCLMKPREVYPPRASKQLPPTRTFDCEAIIWIAAGQDQQAVPDETICDIMDDLDTVMKPIPPHETQTLGGLVHLCYVEGDVTCIPGDVDGLGMIHIPIKIIVP